MSGQERPLEGSGQWGLPYWKFWLVSFKPCPPVLPRASLGLRLQKAPRSTRRIPTNGETCRAGKSAIFMKKAMPNEFALFCPFCVFHPGTHSTRNARKQRTPAINRPPPGQGIHLKSESPRGNFLNKSICNLPTFLFLNSKIEAFLEITMPGPRPGNTPLLATTAGRRAHHHNPQKNLHF